MKVVISLVVSAAGVLALFSAFILTISVAHARQVQPVYSLKNLGEKQIASGETVFSVQIKCNIHTELRYIQQKPGADEWCVSGSPGDCAAERIDAAAKACLFDAANTEVIADSKPVPAEPKLTAAQIKEQENRRALESELIKNEQQMLDLKNKQLELRKRELELIKVQGQTG